MRIFDLEGHTERQRIGHRVALLGTCRVHGPFEELVQRGRAVRVWDVGVTTHTLAEALQLIRYIRGDFDIPRLVRPFVFEPEQGPTRTKMDASILDTVDTFFVEISEIQHISYDPYVLNVNKFYSKFISKYGHQLLDWYRAFAAGRVDDAVIASAMAKLSDLDLEEKIWIESLLRHTRRQHVGEADLSGALLDDIMFDPGKQWILVPLFLVPGLGGAQMKDRAKGIEVANQLGKQKNLTVFDPTTLLEKYGVKTALDADGRDVYHYHQKFNEVVADSLLDAAGLVAKSNETTIAVTARINETLVDVHKQRLVLGVDESGLYAHYKNLLDRNSIAGSEIASLANLVVNRLPKFEEYHVLRAGLGELAFVLSSLEFKTVGFEPNTARFEGMKAGLARLGADDPQIARCITIHNTAIPEVPAPNRTLALAHHLIGYTPAQEEQVLSQLSRYGALLITPAKFVVNRPTIQEQDQLLARLTALGFHTVQRVSEELVLCAKSDIALAATR